MITSIELIESRTPPATSKRRCRRAKVTMETLSAKIANGIHPKWAWPRTVKEWRTDPRSSHPSPTNPASATANTASARPRRHPTARSPRAAPASVELTADVSLTIHPVGLVAVVDSATPGVIWSSPRFEEFTKTPV
jgi:hypothetical protein